MKFAAPLAVGILLAACGAPSTSTAHLAKNCVAQTSGLLTVTEVESTLSLDAAGWHMTGEGGSPLLGLLGNGDASYPGFVGRAQRDFENKQPGAQVFHVAEASMDFGSVQMAEKWLAGQRQMNIPNDNPKTRNGVETIAMTALIGDDTFAYQIPGAADGVFTDIQSRVGPYVFGVFTQSSAAYAAVDGVVKLMTSLHLKEQAVCGVA